jgi:hypothetical protein
MTDLVPKDLQEALDKVIGKEKREKKADIEFLSPRLREGVVSKLPTINATVYIIDNYCSGNGVFKTVSIYSEVHNNLQDLAATLFRRGVIVEGEYGVKIVYGPRSIVKVVA